MKYNYYIGIDTGTTTGFALWDAKQKKLISVGSHPIHRAMRSVEECNRTAPVFVRVEDARKRKWFGKSGREQLQGAGSIKRDAVIWEDFLKDLGIDFEMVAPKNNKTKLNDAAFKKMTGWKERTNEHARDAAMLVYGF